MPSISSDHLNMMFDLKLKSQGYDVQVTIQYDSHQRML